jgi:FkbM family methyltransferase
VNVEANPHLIDAFRRDRPEDRNLNVGASDREGVMTFYVIDRTSGRNTFSLSEAEAFIAAHPGFAITERLEIAVTTAQHIVDRECGGAFPDLLSVDAEGHDLAVLQGIDWARGGPKLICVECNDSPTEARLSRYLAEQGYKMVFVAGPNSVFLRVNLNFP